ncbi:OR22C protein, partial [Acromyrmex charruanus]
MQERVTLKKTIAIMKLSLFVIWFWPLPLGTSKCKILCVKLYQCICILMTIGVIASVIYGLVKNKNTNDLDSFMRSLFSLVSLCHVIGNIWCHLIIYQRLQYVTLEMENFCALIKPHEETIVQREYVDKYSNFYGFCISLFYMSLFGLFIGPVMLDQPLPTAAEFPFDASHQPLRAITYIHQIIVGLFISAHLCVNAFMALLLWLASARFKLLTEEFRTITNIYNLAKCIEKHQKLIKYAGEVALTVRPFAMVTVLFTTVALITFGLVFIASTSVAQAAFETDWYAKSEYLRKNLQMVILRSQKPILVALPCGLPSLSLRYYASNITFEAEYFCNSMKPREEVVIQRYIDKCATFYGVSSIIFYFIVVAACAIAPIVHQPFPMLIEYPFDVYYEPLRTIIYTHQAIVGFIVSGQLCLNTFVATLLWFASARLEIITEDLRTFTNVYQLTKCIKEHQKILEYTAEVIIVARCFALTCICCSTINLIIIGVSFLTNQSLLLRFKYTFMILACLAEVFMFAWPAERLIFLSNDISQAAFDTHWYNQSDEIRKLLQIIMLRSQKVVTIAVPCITPSINFNYLTSVRERETEI